VEKPHKKLKVWQLAMEIVVDIYKLTESFPPEEVWPYFTDAALCS